MAGGAEMKSEQFCNSMLDMLIGYSCIQIRILLLLLLNDDINGSSNSNSRAL